MKSNFNIILFIFYVTLSSCTSQNCIDIPSRFTQQIEIEEAKKIVNERIQKSTKVSSENEKRLFRFNSELIWDNARTSFTERTYSIDIPVKDAKDLYFILRDGDGHYVSRCYHVVTLVKDRMSESISVLNHYYIPFRSCVDLMDEISHDGDIYSLLQNNTDKSFFSGLEVYTTLDGYVTEYLRNQNGNIYDHLFYKNESGPVNLIGAYLSYYLYMPIVIDPEHPEHNHTKSAVPSYLCPRCSSLLSYLNPIGYVCMECGWNELTGMDDDLDPSICFPPYPSGGGSNNDDDPIIPGNDSEIGGGSGSGGNSGIGINNNAFITDENYRTLFAGTFAIIQQDCFGRALINALAERQIQFIQTPNMSAEMMYYKNRRGERYIKYSISSPARTVVLLEEMFHALQDKNQDLNHSYYLNCEIEAKMAIYIYCKKNNILVELPKLPATWNSTFGAYLNNPHETNYSAIIDFLRAPSNANTEGLGYQSVEEFPESALHRPMRNIAPLFIGCTEYQNENALIQNLTNGPQNH